METIEFRARCPKCKTERLLIGQFQARSPAELNLIESKIDKLTFIVRCSKCNATEEVAMFVDSSQVEPWQDGDKYERQNGPSAGPLPPKPWSDNN